MRNKIKGYIEALHAMPIWYQGLVCFLMLAAGLMMIAAVFTALGSSAFKLQLTSGVIEFEKDIDKLNIGRVIAGLMLTIGFSSMILLSCKRYEFMSIIKIVMLSAIFGTAVQSIENPFVYAGISIAYICALSWAMVSTWQSLKWAMITSIVYIVISLIQSKIRLVDANVFTRMTIAEGLYYIADVWALMIGIILVDYANLINKTKGVQECTYLKPTS